MQPRMSRCRVQNAIWFIRRSPPAASSRRSGEGACGLRRAPQSPAAAFFGLVKPVEQPRRAGADERLDAVRLVFLLAEPRQGALGAKELDLPPHLAVPPVGVELARIHENAHLGYRLELCRARAPHI